MIVQQNAIDYLRENLDRIIPLLSTKGHVWEHAYPIIYIPDASGSLSEHAQAEIRPESDFVLYIHVPFCTQKCDFCILFRPGNIKTFGSKDYVDCLEAELANWPAAKNRTEIASIYMGGGTPTLLAPADFTRLFRVIRGRFPIAKNADISIETEPQYMTSEMAEAFAEAKVTETIFGVQTFNEDKLRSINRLHQSNRQIYDGVALLRERTQARVAFDLIYGFGGPSETADDFLADNLRHIIELRPDTVVVHPLQHYQKFPRALQHFSAQHLAAIYRTLGEHLPPQACHSQYYYYRKLMLADVFAIGLGGYSEFWRNGSYIRRRSRYDESNDYAGYKRNALERMFEYQYWCFPPAESLRWYVVWNMHNSYGVDESLVRRMFPALAGLFGKMMSGIADVVETRDGKWALRSGYERLLPFKTENDEINYFIFSFCYLYSDSIREKLIAYLKENLQSI